MTRVEPDKEVRIRKNRSIEDEGEYEYGSIEDGSESSL